MKVVVFSPSDSYTSDSIPTLGEDDSVTVVCWAPSQKEGRIEVVQNVLAARLVSAAAGNVLSRTFVRALPLDTGARFWRATRSNQKVREAVRHADLLIAPERDGSYAAWSWYKIALRKGREIAAVAGYPAARSVIGSAR